MLYATDYEILRNLEANGTLKVALARQPKRLATLLNEEKFLESGELAHLDTVFLEDRFHDWLWQDGFLRYYSRIVRVSDVVVIYASAATPAKHLPT